MPFLQIDDLRVEVVRKAVRHSRLTVRPPAGEVRITVPPRTSEATIRELIMQKKTWIRKHQASFQTRPPEPVLRYESGETHYYQGQALRLHVHERPGPAQVSVHAGELLVQLPGPATAAQRAHVLARWRRTQLQALLPHLLAK